MTQTCKNCGLVVDNKFCPACGQKTSVSRFTMKHLFHDFVHGFFHIDHGIFFTAKELLINPGKMLRNYLAGHRIRYFNPYTFILLVGGFSAFLLPRIHWQSYFIDIGVISNKAINQEAWNSSLKHFSLRLLFSIPLNAVITKSFYYAKDYNFSEHLIANTFIRAELCVLMICLSPLEVLLHPIDTYGIFKSFIVVVMVLYVSWAYAGLFDGRITFFSLAKGFLVSLISAIIELTILNTIILKKFPF